MSKVLRWLGAIGEQLELWAEHWEGDSWGAVALVRGAYEMVRNAEELVRRKEEEEKGAEREAHLRSPRVKWPVRMQDVDWVEFADPGKRDREAAEKAARAPEEGSADRGGPSVVKPLLGG